MKTLIKNASVVFPEEVLQTSVLLEGSKIVDIDVASQIDADEVIDATGLHLLPGVIDDQVHFREPGLTHKEDLASASRACAKGGVTTFLEMPNTIPATTTQERLEEKLALASRTSMVNYGFYIGATPENLSELVAANRTPGIKIFLGSSTGDLLVDQQDALERIFAETTLPITAHCEDEATIQKNAEQLGPPTTVADHSKIRDVAAAVVATRRALDLAHRHRLICIRRANCFLKNRDLNRPAQNCFFSLRLERICRTVKIADAPINNRETTIVAQSMSWLQ